MKIKIYLLLFILLFTGLRATERVIEDIVITFVTADPESSGYITKDISIMNLQETANDMEIKKIAVISDNLLAIKKVLQPFFYKSLKETVCERIEERLTEYFQRRNYQFFNISCQTKESRIQIQIVFGYLGKKKVIGNKYCSAKKIQSKIQTQPGELVDPVRVERDLFWINTNPFRSVNLIYTPGETFGSTDIVLDVSDRRPYRVYSGYENTDNNVGGNSRLFAGINFGNFLFLDQELNYQLLFSPDWKEYHAHSGSYIIPLPWKNFLKFFGAYSHSRPPSDGTSVAKGDNWSISGQYVVPFVTKNFYKHSISVGYLYQNLNNFFEYNYVTQKRNEVDISQFHVFYELVKDINRSSFIFNTKLFYSPGKMTPHNRNRYFQAERGGAKCRYVFGTAGLDSMIHLQDNWFWSFALRGQLSSTKLMPTEELSLGGIHSIRGYKENVVIGDFGMIMNNELRLSNIRVFKKVKDQLIVLLFHDFGFAKEIDKNLFDLRGSWLMSIGPGIRYNISDYFNLRFDYGFQLNRVYKHSIGKAHFQAVLTY